MVKTMPVNRYLWEIYRELPGNWKQKRQILSRAADSVRSFAEARPGTDYDAVVARFGTPRQIAASYVEEMEPPELLENLKTGRRVFCIVLAAVLVALAMWAGVVVNAYLEHVNDHDGVFVEEIVVIEDIPNETGG